MPAVRRLVPSALAVASVALVGLSAAAPASAATPSLKLCADDNGKGKCLTRTAYDSNFNNDRYCGGTNRTITGDERCKLFKEGSPITFEDKTSSVYNRTSKWWKLYEDRGYKGYVLCLRPYGYDSNLGNNTPQEDDISSAKIQGTSQPRGCDQVIG